MTKEKAAELLGYLVGMIEDNQENDYDTALKMAINALNADRWIPVTEHRPKKSGDYIITWKCHIGFDEYRIITTLGYFKPYATYEWGSYTGEVTAWMPLPDPWKGGAE